MIQILGLRDYVDKKGNTKKAEKFFDRGWRATSVPFLFANIDTILETIPQEEHWNLYYTAALCKEVKGRKLEQQNVIPIDIDNIDVNKVDEYVTLICNELNLEPSHTGIVFSGNGLQFIIGIKDDITDSAYFDKERHLYKAMCGKINQALYLHGLEGDADTSVFSAGRLLRLPNTLNRKPNKPERKAYLINAHIELIDFNLSKLTGTPELVEGEHIHPRAYLKFPDPDPIGVQDGCEFIKHCKKNPASLSEPQWYAMLSIVGRLPNGQQLCHEYSSGHPDYDSDSTDFKYSQALEASGPRTCDNIDSLWDGCSVCPYYGKCKSPIMLRSESYIGTKETGFYDMVVGKDGTEKRGKPNYDDIVKYYHEVNPYCTMEKANIVHTHDGKKWVDISRNRIHSFSEEQFEPSPNNMMCNEFEQKLKRTHLQDQDWFNVDGFINFSNGILDLEKLELNAHSADYGFKYVLPFDYDSTADCPRFKQFLKEVTLDREELINVLVEFMGYSVMGIDPALGQKALILWGEGANGKSVLIDVLRALAGKDNYSTLNMGQEINKLENRYQLAGKLFNISEETPSGAMVDSSVFKALVAGGEVQARKLYCDSFSMRNYAKIIMACNELPRTDDLTHGMLRRLLIVPFDARFTRDTRDANLTKYLVENELSGIFNLCVEGYQRFIRLGNNFTESGVIERTIEEYVEENDTVQTFLLDECVYDTEHKEPMAKIYAAYKFHSERAGAKPLTQSTFGKRIKRKLQDLHGTDPSVRIQVDGRRVRGYSGVKLLETGGAY